MATNYLKPQEPLQKIDKETGDINYIYPLVTNDQVILEDGTRLNAKLNMIDTDIAEKADASDIITLQSALDDKLSTTGIAAKAMADASGNNIINTYATKVELGTVQTTANAAMPKANFVFNAETGTLNITL